MRLFIPLLFATAPLHAAVPTAPTGQFTNGIENPQAIDVAAPSFSWIMNDTDRGETQTSRQNDSSGFGRWHSTSNPFSRFDQASQ